ncbi:MAG: paraquat-inducible protein A [Myxococcota bacterium]
MTGELLLCHDCDLPNRIGVVEPDQSARCPRCDGLLWRNVPDSLDRTIAFALGGLMLYVVSNSFPFLSMVMQGNVTETTLATGVRALFDQGRPLVASLVLLTTILAPLIHLTTILYVLLPLKLGTRAPGARLAFRLLHRIETWSMMEVFLIGILVSLTKLVGMAQIVPGIALWSFVTLIPLVAATSASLDSHWVWERIGAET